MKKIFSILIVFFLIVFGYKADAQKISKLVKDANSFYKAEKFDQAIKVCEVILLNDSETADDISAKASANWLLCWTYRNLNYLGRDANKAYQYLNKTSDLYNQLFSKYPDLRKYMSNLSDAVKKEQTMMLDLFPGVASGNYKSAEQLKEIENTIIAEIKSNKEESSVSKSVQNNNLTGDSEATNNIKIQSTNSEEVKPSENQNNIVTLTVVGVGKNVEEARINGLRSAIEQAFGTFISSNTTILNDKLINDEIVSVNNGNIQKYDILNENKLPDGNYATTLKTIVSVSKLKSFCIAKGVNVEFKGGLFAMNIAMQELNEKSEITAWNNTKIFIDEIINKCVDYSLSITDPIFIKDSMYKIPIKINIKTNNNFSILSDLLIQFIKSSSMSYGEVTKYKGLNKKVYTLIVDNDEYFFRNEVVISEIVRLPWKLLRNSISNFVITNNLGQYTIKQLLDSNLYDLDVKDELKNIKVVIHEDFKTPLLEFYCGFPHGDRTSDDDGFCNFNFEGPSEGRYTYYIIKSKKDNEYLMGSDPNLVHYTQSKKEYFLSLDYSYLGKYQNLFDEDRLFDETFIKRLDEAMDNKGRKFKFNFLYIKEFITLIFNELRSIREIKEINEYKINLLKDR